MNRDSGFTIIEVILFLAISGLLLAGVMAGISGNIGNSRFTDATNNLEAYLQQQYSEVQAGVSDRADTARCPYSGTNEKPGASDNCIVIGKLVTFGNDRTLSFPVVAKISTTGCPTTGSGIVKEITSHCPRSLGTSTTGVRVDDHQYNWGITMVKKQFLTNGTATANDLQSLAILRSPETGSIETFVLADGPDSANANFNLYGTGSSPLTTGNMNAQAVMCLKSPDILSRRSYIRLSGGQGSDVIKSGEDQSLLPQGLSC